MQNSTNWPLRARLRLANRINPNQPIGGSNLLALVFRKIRNDLSIVPKDWAHMMNVYTKNPLNEVPQTSRGRSSEASNLQRGLSVPDLSIQNFLKGIRVIAPESMGLKVTAEFEDGRVVTSSYFLDKDKLYLNYHNEKYPNRPNPFTIMFDDIRNQLGYNVEPVWNQLMDEYICRSVHTLEKRSSERSYLQRALGNPAMTFKVWMKGMMIMKPMAISLEVDLGWSWGNNTTHRVRMEGLMLERNI